MGCQIFKSDGYCVDGRHESATKNIYCDKTSEGKKVLIGFCSFCNRKKIMTASGNTTQSESLRDCFKNLGKKGPKVPKN